MNKFVLFVFALVVVLNSSFAQSLKPSALVAEASVESSPTRISLFSLYSDRNTPTVPTELKEYSILQLDRAAIENMDKTPSKFISLSIPQSGRSSLELELVAVNPFAEDFTIRTAPSNQTIKANLGRHYRGIIKGVPSSVAAISIFEGELIGMVSHPMAVGNMVIGKLANSDLHIIYQDDQIANQFSFDCQAKDKEFEYTAEQLRGVVSSERALTDCTRLYLEVDNDIYISKGSNTTTVTTFITGLFNQVSSLYANEQINMVISEIIIWTEASPYNSTSSIGMLNAFTNYRQGFNGDLAQLLSYKASGGVAYVDGLCRTNPDYSMSYAGINTTYQNVPTYSWSVEVCTHEFGHLFGSQHTHACVWNGNNTAIDGCYTTEGGCANPGLPSGGGTIMSYCHLTSAGINFSNGFGTQPGNVIRSEVTTATCLQPCGDGGGGDGGGGTSCSDNELILTILLDSYPGETTWTIKNAGGTTIYSGGPYSVPNSSQAISLCLPTACYTFTINDSYGDGICCAYGSGYYNLKQGTTTLISGGQFGASETKTFCASGTSNPTCSDGVQNGSETGVDCGGTNCPACPTCTDGIQNGSETGVDCGGANCPACPTCTDGIQNGSETGVDCGGAICPACPTCSDGIQNGNETGVDCGGSCSPCGNGSTVITELAGNYFETGWDGWIDGGADCARYTGSNSPEGLSSIRIRDNDGEFSSMTSVAYDLTPYDSVTVAFSFRTVGMETGEDFWLQYYNGSSWQIVASYAFPTNFNNNQIYSRSVKITGPLSGNAKFKFTADASDNTDQIYIDAVVIKGYKTAGNATCTDGIQNGSETGIDCGGANCPACPTCTDGVQNGSESGVDCGGTNCPACPTCTDGIQNGNETGIDCGGTCAPCNGGGTTVLSGHYFETGWDGWLDGGSDCFRYAGNLSPEGNSAIRLRDNSGEQSAMTSPSYDLSTYNTVSVEFQFRAAGMESGKDFWLLYNGGGAWQNVGTLISGTHFNNDIVYTATINVSGSLNNNAMFRFQADGADNSDIVYIDAVVISGTTGSNLIESPISITVNPLPIQNYQATEESNINIYPNPTSGVLNVVAQENINNIMVYNLAGQLVLNMKTLNTSQEIDLGQLQPGMYILKVETEENVFTERIVKR